MQHDVFSPVETFCSRPGCGHFKPRILFPASKMMTQDLGPILDQTPKSDMQLVLLQLKGTYQSPEGWYNELSSAAYFIFRHRLPTIVSTPNGKFN